MFNNLFYIKTEEYDYIYNRKILNIFGIKISYLKKKSKAQRGVNKQIIPQEFIYRANCNLVNILFHMMNAVDINDLYCLRNDTVCYIFNKNILKFGHKNFCNFILNSRYSLKTLLSFEKLDMDSNMYKEHISRSKNNEFLWKYMIRNTILHKFLSFDEEKRIYVNEKMLFNEYYEDENNKSLLFRARNSKRLFIQGSTVYNYLENKSNKEKIKILIKLIDYIFETYGVGDNMIDGSLYDCHLSNFVIDSNENFYFVDDEYISPNPISKEHVVKYILKYYNNDEVGSELYKHFCIKSINEKRQSNNILNVDKLQKMKMEYFK